MIKHYIIDGNNLIGKINRLADLQKKDPLLTRDKLNVILTNYFEGKKVSVSLHYDGYESFVNKTNNIKIFFSGSRTADELIKDEIMRYKNPKLICVVSSDKNIIEFSHVNSCYVKTGESFAKEIFQRNKVDIEEKIVKSISSEEIKRMFGV